MAHKIYTKALKQNSLNSRAFTLLEMLLVIAIIAILAGIVIVAINPGRQLAQARNAERASDLRAIHSAVHQYYIDNKAWPTGLDGTVQDVCKYGITDNSCINLDVLVPDYLSTIPEDPQSQSPTSTDYQLVLNTNTNSIGLTAVKSTEYNLDDISLGLSEDDAAWIAFVAETYDIMEAIKTYVADRGGDYMTLVQGGVFTGTSYETDPATMINFAFLVRNHLDPLGYIDYNPNYGKGIVTYLDYGPGYEDFNNIPNIEIIINYDFHGCYQDTAPYFLSVFDTSIEIDLEDFKEPWANPPAPFSNNYCLKPSI